MALTGLTNLQPLHIKTVGIGTFDNTVSIGGTLTYEDVTNVDAIGIVTARTGVNVSGGQLDVGSNIKLGNAGVITATSFVGSVTGNVTGNISGGTVAGSTGTFTGDLSIAQNLVHTGDTDTKLEFGADTVKLFTAGTQKFRIYDDGVVSIGQSSKSSTVGAGNLDIQGNATNCILEMGNPFPGFSGGVTPEFRITATNSSHEVKFESIWGGDNALHPHMAFTGGRTHFYKATNSDEIARFDADRFFIGQTTGSSRLCVSDTNPVIAELHHSDGGTNDEARLILGALANNPPSNRGAGIAAVNNGAGHDLTVKCSTNHSSGPSEKVRFKSNGDVSITNGNLVIGTSGKGIDFSASGGPQGSGGTELLDDYEAGTFTPVLQGSTGSGTATHTHQTGNYVKIGRNCTIFFNIFTTNTASWSGNLRIAGLPFTTGTSVESVAAVQWNRLPDSGSGSSTQSVFAVLQNPNTFVEFRKNQSGTAQFSYLSVQNVQYMRVSMTYITA